MLTVLLLQKLSGRLKVFVPWLHLLLFEHMEQILITALCCCSSAVSNQLLCNCTAQLLLVQNSNYCCLEVKCWLIEVGDSSVSGDPSELRASSEPDSSCCHVLGEAQNQLSMKTDSW